MENDVRPSLSILRWLTDPGVDLAPAVRNTVMAELLSSPSAILMGAVNGLIIKCCALYLVHRTLFASLAVLEVFCCIIRLLFMIEVKAAGKRRQPIHLDISLTLTILWCLLQGVSAFVFMRTGNAAIEILSATTIMGIIGPICARNYSAPRLALFLVCLCDFPFVAGGATSGEAWLYVLIPMTPPFLFGTMKIIKNFQRVAFSAMTGELVGHQMARRDPLTGLNNRLAFTETLESIANTGIQRYTLFCIDLDGFKCINDSLGHHGGDELLRTVAHRLMVNVKSTDQVFRIGGDEFVLVAFDLFPNDAAKLAARIIDQLTYELYNIRGATAKIGASIGFVCSPEDGSDGQELYRLADAALYAAKATGKGVNHRPNLRVITNTPA